MKKQDPNFFKGLALYGAGLLTLIAGYVTLAKGAIEMTEATKPQETEETEEEKAQA